MLDFWFVGDAMAAIEPSLGVADEFADALTCFSTSSVETSLAATAPIGGAPASRGAATAAGARRLSAISRVSTWCHAKGNLESRGWVIWKGVPLKGAMYLGGR